MLPFRLVFSFPRLRRLSFLSLTSLLFLAPLMAQSPRDTLDKGDYARRVDSSFLLQIDEAKTVVPQLFDSLSHEQRTLLLQEDSLKVASLAKLQSRIARADSLRKIDSLARLQLEQELLSARTSNKLQKEEIQAKIDSIKQVEATRKQEKQSKVDSVRQMSQGYPVVGVLGDTLATLYARIGSYSASERAERISMRIRRMYESDFSEKDSLYLDQSQDYADIMYRDQIVMTVTDNDALINGTSIEAYAEELQQKITASLMDAKNEYSLQNTLKRVGLVLLSIVLTLAVLYLIARIFRWLKKQVNSGKVKFFRDLKYRDYTFITVEQETSIVLRLLTVIHWAVVLLLLLVVIPIVFSIFPFTRSWSSQIFQFVWTPVKDILVAIWNYLPSLFNILVVVIVLRYVVKLVRYFFGEIEQSKLKLPGFHPDFARPTFVIVRTLLIIFGVILIFPYLPGAGSEAFNGISVFVGVLFSLGSSSAIANMIAGIVITYMRPFKIGDRIKVDGIVGDVVEKSLLVTKLKQVTNEEVTIPNSKILNSNTINYSALVETKGLILSTEVTMGFDVPWKEVETLLLEAIARCPRILPAPKPFVLQMEFRDFYTVYTVNGYTTEPNSQAAIYSEIRGHIQDVCREQGVELMSPHYHEVRDRIQSTIPPEYEPPKKPERPVPRVNGERN